MIPCWITERVDSEHWVKLPSAFLISLTKRYKLSRRLLINEVFTDETFVVHGHYMPSPVGKDYLVVMEIEYVSNPRNWNIPKVQYYIRREVQGSVNTKRRRVLHVKNTKY